MSDIIPQIAIIGAAKSGTTTLANLLALHPGICLGKEKEPEFFSFDEHFQQGFDVYRNNFSHAKPGQLTLDASTGYTRYPQYPNSAQRLHDASPDAKLIYLMRHPVDRAYSHYIHRFTKECYQGQPIDRSFEEYVVTDPMCVDSSDYRLQIESYLALFPREHMLFLFSDDLRSDNDTVLKTVCNFLDLDYDEEYFKTNDGHKNLTSDYLESRIRIKLTDNIKKIPGVKQLIPILPQSLKEKAYQLLKRSSLSNSIEAEYTPPPLTDEVRAKYLEYFADTTRWIEELTGRKLQNWHQ